MKKLREYHFSAGNSSTGPVGFCAVVRAHSKLEAVKILESVIPEEEYSTGMEANDETGSVVYLNVYFNSLKISTRHIDEVTDVQLCPACEEPLDDGEEIVGCPDGAEIHRSCFNAGAH